jgi:hypothetical protein
MASLTFDSFVYDNSTGAIDLDADTFKIMLVTSAYTPNKKTHTKRSDVTNEVTGTGYTAGGVALASVVVTNDTANDRTKFASANPSWASATITARGAVIYKSRGGAATADELVCYLDFGSDQTSTNGPFTVTCPANGWMYNTAA